MLLDDRRSHPEWNHDLAHHLADLRRRGLALLRPPTATRVQTDKGGRSALTLVEACTDSLSSLIGAPVLVCSFARHGRYLVFRIGY